MQRNHTDGIVEGLAKIRERKRIREGGRS
jgi:hypothetical protein